MKEEKSATRPDIAALIARCRAGAQDIEYDGYSLLLREAANALAGEQARADKAERDADAHSRDAQHERKLRREAQQKIAEVLKYLDQDPDHYIEHDDAGNTAAAVEWFLDPHKAEQGYGRDPRRSITNHPPEEH